MCGIAGIAQRSGISENERFALQRMLDAISHRGPDDSGSFVDRTAAIGMRRLSIIDLEGGHQPIANEDRTIWVACNGEIYNYRQLRSRLQALGHVFSTGSDVETIVHAYEQYGEDCFTHLEGMFGAAIWDCNQGRLLIARDPLGIKPLYYSVSPQHFAFASEMKALLHLPWVSKDICFDGLREYLSLGHAAAPTTLLTDVKKLPPATYMVWEGGAIRERCYWSLPESVDHRPTEGEWIERVRAELGRAVRDHMVSDVPIGAFLSGGIDSSSIVGLMSRADSNPVNTYAIGYCGSDVANYYNELPFAHAVAERFGTMHREIQVAPNVAELLPRLLWHVEEPISDSAMITTYLVSELAADSVKVIMSGVGGDELFGGYTRYLGEYYGSRYRRIPGWIRSRLIEPVAARLPSARSSRWLDLARYVKEFVRSEHLEWDGRYRSYIGLADEGLLDCLASRIPVGEDAFDRVVSSIGSEDPLLRLLSIDTRFQLPESLLLLSDKMTMAASIECRVPFLDKRLVELAATIPTEHKLPAGRLKSVLKEAVSDLLLPEVLRRKKRGFGAPLGAWFQKELGPLRSELLSRESVARRGLVDPAAVAEICSRHDQQREDMSDLIMVLVNLEIWCRTFIDGQQPGDLSGELNDRMLSAGRTVVAGVGS